MTKLFDLIAHHGHRVTERRAHKADPDLAAREAARRVVPGVVLGTEGPGGLDGLFEDMKIEQQYRPWWWKTSLHLHWWAGDWGLRPVWGRLRNFYDRGKRGWCVYDTYSFDTYMAKIIRDAVRHMNEVKHGWPGDPMTFEEWTQILDEIAEGMQAHLDMSDVLSPVDEKAGRAKRDLALDHLKQYWGHLWD